MKIVALILAKQNSKRLKGKNWIDFNGKPMFVWNLLKCLTLFDKTYVSSDAKFILDIAKKYGAIPIHRPFRLCGDIPSVNVFQHALKFINTDVVISVQANSPTINSSVIQSVKMLMKTGKFQEIMTCKRKTEDEFEVYGSVWALTKERIKNYKNPYDSEAELFVPDPSVDIHFQLDVEKALKQI